MTNYKLMAIMVALIAAATAVARVSFSPVSDKATPTLLPTATPTPASPQLVLADFQYPGAETTRLTGQSLYLKSTDEVGAITNWYRARIESLKMNLKNFIQTTVNGEASHQLTAADERGKIKVLIEKKKSENNTQITVTIN